MTRTLTEIATLLDGMARDARDDAARLADYPRAACRETARSQLLAALASDIRAGRTQAPSASAGVHSGARVVSGEYRRDASHPTHTQHAGRMT